MATHVSLIYRGTPEGALSYNIRIYDNPNMEEPISIAGPYETNEAIVDQEYLVPLYEDEREDLDNTNYLILIQFRDAVELPEEYHTNPSDAGNIIGEQLFVAGCCND